MATVNTWDNVCRLCSEEKYEMLSIFGNEGLQRKVAQKLRACLPVLVYQTDPLPKQICQFCAARLDDIYEFREYCLNVYRNMYGKLLMCKQTEPVRIFLDAMKNSTDPCLAQLCKEKPRAVPALLRLSTLMPYDNSVAPINQVNQDQLQNTCMETLPELPCEVEIKEMSVDPVLNVETAACETPNAKLKLPEIYDTGRIMNILSIFDSREEKELSKAEYQMRKEEKRTSILEQVLTGNLTMNKQQKLQPKTRLSSEWWCPPCNSYYKTRDILAKHLQFHCPRVYACKRCSLSFKSVEILAKHEANSHLKVRLDCIEDLKDCHQCDRQFVCWKMLKQHRLRDHSAELTDIETNTWCSLCNRFFPTVRAYQDHIQLHETNDNTMLSQKLLSTESAFPVPKMAERPKEIKRIEQFYENAKSLICPTCGKICTQQSALSNHMRTHEPKRFKCDICGRSFGLVIRLAAHKMSEHNKQPTMSPVMSAVEQEEALNAEREAREAREARTRGIKRPYSEMVDKSDVSANDEFVKRNCTESQNVARCGICSRWFNNHTAMLTHLQTHSDNYPVKSFICHVCKKSFKEQWKLFKHEMCHKRIENASLHTCTTCNISFLDKASYKAHQKTHTVDKTYHCAKCNKIFFKEVSLLTHQCGGETPFRKMVTAEPLQKTLSYSSSKKYKCSKCDTSFSSSQSRNAHMKMHTDGMYNSTPQKHEIKIEADDEQMPQLRPETSLEYDISPIEPKIEISEQSIPPPLKRTLIKTGSGFRCGVCKSPFVSRDLAVAHLRSAHPVMPYQCPYCKKRFTTQYTFTHHIKKEHPDEPEK